MTAKHRVQPAFDASQRGPPHFVRDLLRQLKYMESVLATRVWGAGYACVKPGVLNTIQRRNIKVDTDATRMNAEDHTRHGSAS